MRRIDELYLASPFYGSRRMTAVLRREGWPVNRKRIRRLMRVMALEAIYQKPNTSRKHPDHKVYPYLLRNHPAGTALSARPRCPTLRAFLRAPLRMEHTADGDHYRN
jgi:transposase InsO family protein